MKTVNIKIDKIKSLVPKKAMRIILWVILGILMLRGVVGLIKPDQSSELYKNLKDELVLFENQNKLQEEANSFAEGFIREFLNFKQGSGEEYKNRITKYMSLQALSSVNTTLVSDLLVLDATTIKSTSYEANKYNVDVRAKVQYATGITKDLFLRVPVAANNGLFTIEDVPLFIAEPGKAEVESEQISGTTVDTNITNNIKDTLDKFLRVYAEGQAGEITYYLSDANIELKSLNGNLKFKGISELNVYSTSENKFMAIVKFSLEDQEIKQEMKQVARLSLVFKESKYYIEKFDTRFSEGD